ncbi:hypothetical protein [Alicyclobacillus mali (ex Roth et al. 2021)]|uniref:hypothetical protein n=1 Tax=Alicyclobacillus mali (ex Roth et al. 2021) TaxID=1123961 RepID=UPI000AC3A026|nr:hypothetical protein [Alicyclobacillus mali (ex Roth et al. 2021)]
MAPVFVLLAPIVGALCSNLVPGTAVPLGFWRGLVVQCALIAAPLAATWWGPVRWRNLLFHRAGARASLGLGIAYSAVYLLLLFAAQRAGLHVSHFNLARRTLGLPCRPCALRTAVGVPRGPVDGLRVRLSRPPRSGRATHGAPRYFGL